LNGLAALAPPSDERRLRATVSHGCGEDRKAFTKVHWQPQPMRFSKALPDPRQPPPCKKTDDWWYKDRDHNIAHLIFGMMVDRLRKDEC